MTILDKNVLTNARPFISFCVVHYPLNNVSHKFNDGVFCELPQDLIGTYCNLTRSYAPFDIHENTQLGKPYDIYLMASQLMLWAFQLARSSDNYFNQEAEFWAESHALLNGAQYSGEQFKADLLETLHFLIGKMYEAAANRKSLIIVGV
jgi:hypothetical protein